MYIKTRTFISLMGGEMWKDEWKLLGGPLSPPKPLDKWWDFPNSNPSDYEKQFIDSRGNDMRNHPRFGQGIHRYSSENPPGWINPPEEKEEHQEPHIAITKEEYYARERIYRFLSSAI